ncbi:MAG: RIP metalloprotease RseP [Rhodospirillales bacterium]|jgi:regulator of sigma E protease|nr:RIP metalloprotease RseP [Rhodospirillales bacterium]
MVSILEYIWDWVIPFLIVLSVLVFVHELGHYLVARLCRVRIETFSIGFGPEVFGWNDQHGTRWKVSAVPLGGYVKMFGEHDFDDKAGDAADREEMSEADRAVSFHHKSLRQRTAIVAAGPLANFLFAVVLFAALFATAGVPAPLAGVGYVQPDSAAARAGFAPGDRVVAIDGEPVRWFEDLRRIVSERADQPTRFAVRRGEETIELTATPQATAGADGAARPVGMLGIRPDGAQVGYERVGPLTATAMAGERVISITAQIGIALWEIVSGSRTASELGGPLRIAQLSGEMAQDGIISLVVFMAALSINLGLINLLPIPMLDGGHLAFYAAEAVRGRPLDRRLQEYGFRFGLVFVLLLIILATWNDLMSLKVFDFVKTLIS